MTTCGIYILWDTQDVSKFYLLFQKKGRGANAPFAPLLCHCTYTWIHVNGKLNWLTFARIYEVSFVSSLSCIGGPLWDVNVKLNLAIMHK